MKTKSKSLDEIVDKISIGDRHSTGILMLYAFIAFLAFGGWVAYSFYEVSMLNRNLGQRDRDVEPVRNLVDQSRAAAAMIDSEAPSNERSSTIVEYVAKDADQEKGEAALKRLGFTIKKNDPQPVDRLANCIWFGSEVNIEDVKLVAYALIRSGAQLKQIAPFQNSTGKEHVIKVGGKIEVMNIPAFTVEELRKRTAFTQNAKGGSQP
jgi:hypothetical protein